jgi:hypothetical protein
MIEALCYKPKVEGSTSDEINGFFNSLNPFNPASNINRYYKSS